MPQRWNAPDFSGIVDSFLRPYLLTKQAKEQELQDKLMYELAQRRQIEDEKYRQYLREKEAADRNLEEAKLMRPEVVGGQQTGYSLMRPGQLPTTGPYPEQAYEPQFTPIPGMQPQKEPKTPGGFNLGAGQARYEFDPATGQYRQVASMPGRPTAGGGYSKGQAIGHSFSSLDLPAQTTEEFTKEGGYKRTQGAKMIPSLQQILARADSLYNMQNYGQFNAPAGAIQRGQPEPVIGDFYGANSYQEAIEGIESSGMSEAEKQQAIAEAKQFFGVE